MTPQFASAELNHLLQLELAEGTYRSSEEALLAGLKALRDSRDCRVNLYTSGGAGLQAGVDLSDNASLLDIMDERDGPARP